MTIKITFENMSFAYRTVNNGKVPVFRETSLTLPGGGIIGVIGRNGSGKSTLFDLIRGRIKPDTGTIHIHRDKQLQKQTSNAPTMVSLVTQRPDASLCPTMTILENYALVCSPARWSPRWAFNSSQRQACRRLVSTANMGLERNIDEQARFLSGGQKQALAVLFALSLERSILLMDEPTAALDHISATTVLNLAAEYGKQNNGIVAIISHRLEELLEVCDTLVVVGGGGLKQMTAQDVTWTLDGVRSLL